MITTPTRYRYRRPLGSLRQELDRIFGEFVPTTTNEMEEEVRSSVWTPRVDFSEDENEYLLKMDLPGLDKDSISVNVDDHMLTISGERKEEKKEEKEDFILLERAYGNFHRSLKLPQAAKVDDVKAQFKNGVLKINIPKAEEKKGRRVDVG